MSNEPNPWSQEGWQQQTSGWSQPTPDPEPWRSAPPPTTPSANEAWRTAPPPAWPQPGAQQAPVANPYTPQGFPPASAQPKPNTTIPLVLIGIAFALSLLFDWMCASAYGDLAALTKGTLDPEAAERTEEGAQALMRAGGWIMAQVVPAALGIVGLVLSIRARSHPQTKSSGTLGLTLALIAPLVSFVFFLAVTAVKMAPHLPQ